MDQVIVHLPPAQDASRAPVDVMSAWASSRSTISPDRMDLLPPGAEVLDSLITSEPKARDEAFEAQVTPFSGPREVLAHPALGNSEKRALLASWASDACAVENLPNWRKLPETGSLVALDEILDALQALDDGSLH